MEGGLAPSHRTRCELQLCSVISCVLWCNVGVAHIPDHQGGGGISNLKTGRYEFRSCQRNVSRN